MPTAELHPAVRRALALAPRYRPANQPGAAATAPDAETALRRLLRDRLEDASAGAAAAGTDSWNGSEGNGNEGNGNGSRSALGRSGFPVEIAIAFGRPELRYTAEVAGPGVPPAARLDRALDALRDLSGETLPPGDAAALAAIQRGGRLTYGAWIGGRHGAGPPAFKLYAEVPETGEAAALDWASATLGNLSGVTRRGAWPVMIGVQGGGRVELYFRTRRLFRGDISLLLEAAGLPGRAGEVLDLLQDACQSRLEAALPAADFGVSVSAGGDGAPAFTLYAVAHDLFGGDGRIRDTVLRLAAARGWDAAFYRVLSEPLAGCRGFLTRHGMFGIAVAAGQPAGAVIGLTPDAP